ncbi:GNAT family N-acetyltransferase [Minwuia thermotolerans]|nr:GNAT family N-acyltransferase [Minwuia thermotolerans]
MSAMRKLPHAWRRARSIRPKSQKRPRRIIRNVIFFPKIAATKLKERRANKRARLLAGEAAAEATTPTTVVQMPPQRQSNTRPRWSLPDSGPVCSAGSLEVYITRHREAIRAAQALRYAVFYDEMGARPDPVARRLRLDMDRYDDICDHLIVMDRSLADQDQLVGAYRLLRGSVAKRNGGFYSADEYDLTPLMEQPVENLLELGRSCVAASHRSKATIQLLWRGIAAYLAEHRLTTLFGCASFHGRDPKAHAEALSYLHHFHGAPPERSVRALDERYVDMDMVDKDAIDARRVWKAMPPLIKAYLRLGGVIGDGAVIDDQFGTIDVFVTVEMDRVGSRYYAHFDKRTDA